MRRKLATLVAAMLATGTVVAVAPAASANPPATCPAETYPAAGAPLNSTSQPRYAIPFTASLAGGYLEINSPNSAFTVILGGPIQANGDGSIFATACGLTYLPQENGGISGNPYGTPVNNNADTYNNNFIFDDNGGNGIPVTIGLKGLPGVPLLAGFGSAEGFLAAQFQKTPAANGGINVDFFGDAKSTAVINPLASIPPFLQGVLGPITKLIDGTCTVPIGDLRAAGLPAADLAVPAGQTVSPVTGLTYAEEITPTHLTTATSTAKDAAGQVIASMTGQPITGAITGATAKLVSVNFPVAKIDPNTPATPDTTQNFYDPAQTPNTLCNQTSADLFNKLLGLPSPAGYNTFFAPSTFAIHTTA